MWTPLQYMGEAATGTPVASVIASNRTRLRIGRDLIYYLAEVLANA